MLSLIRIGYFALVALVIAAPASALNIVLTNDDGFETHNIQELFKALREAGHDVIMSAPYEGQSGTGGQIAFLEPMGPTAGPSEQGTLPAGSPGVGPTTLGEQQYYVDGSPAASVLYGIDIAAMNKWGRFPDLVISGPNEGNNLGVVTPHSGTLGATVTALNKDIPAIAVSAAGEDQEQAKIVAQLMVKLVAGLSATGSINLPQSIGLNVNVGEIDPATQSAEDFEFKFTRLGESANFGLQFFERLGDSQIAQAFGLPATVEEPGVSVNVPVLAGYPEDTSPRRETNALLPGVVTMSPIQGTYNDYLAPETENSILMELN